MMSNRPKPHNEVKYLEEILFVLIAFICLSVSSCCPKIVEQPPVITDRWDTAAITLPPPPPIIIPPDATAIELDLTQLCDSLWRQSHLDKPITTSGKRIKSGVEVNNNKLLFTCKEDSLIHVLDSVRGMLVRNFRTIEKETVIYQCPVGWPKWLHSVVIVSLVILSVFTVIRYVVNRR